MGHQPPCRPAPPDYDELYEFGDYDDMTETEGSTHSGSVNDFLDNLDTDVYTDETMDTFDVENVRVPDNPVKPLKGVINNDPKLPYGQTNTFGTTFKTSAIIHTANEILGKDKENFPSELHKPATASDGPENIGSELQNKLINNEQPKESDGHNQMKIPPKEVSHKRMRGEAKGPHNDTQIDVQNFHPISMELFQNHIDGMTGMTQRRRHSGIENHHIEDSEPLLNQSYSDFSRKGPFCKMCKKMFGEISQLELHIRDDHEMKGQYSDIMADVENMVKSKLIQMEQNTKEITTAKNTKLFLNKVKTLVKDSDNSIGGCNNTNGSSNGFPAYDGSTMTRATKTCPSPTPTFDARDLKTAKWTSAEEVWNQDKTSLRSLPQTWTPRNQPSPSPASVKPVSFDSNSIKRNQQTKSVTSTNSGNSTPAVQPEESFAWKDSTLERKLKDLKSKQFSDAEITKPKDNGVDKHLGKSLQSWSTALPKPPDADVTLLKKAREEKKVKRYLEDNFQNREGSAYISEPEFGNDSDIGGLTSKYSTLDRRIDSSPPHSPPPFSKAESRYEREQRIKIGSLDSFTPGGQVVEKSLSPPPSASSAQTRYERERFRVQPGRIEQYAPGRCTLAQQEIQKASTLGRGGSGSGGCSITKYSGGHSFNPLMTSKSVSNLSVKKGGSFSDSNHLQRALKDGYESDTAVYKRPSFTPQATAVEAKTLYSQVQKGGEVPFNGLRRDSKECIVPSIKTFQQDMLKNEQDYAARNRDSEQYRNIVNREQVPEEEIRIRQHQQMQKFYQDIEQQKSHQLRVDQESRKHHDTLLPNQKSPVPLNRYEDHDVNGNTSAAFLNAGAKPTNCNMVARALFSFQAQNQRELSFKKGDIIYIKKQVDANWYEGERNATIGIFPVTYVEILPNDAVIKTLPKKETSLEGQAKAKFNFSAQTPMELSLIKGELITLSRRIDRNWFEGRVNSRKGIFPVSYVDILMEPGERKSPAPPAKPAPVAHSILKNASLTASNYAPSYNKQTPSQNFSSPYSTLSRPPSAQSGTQHSDKPEPIPFRALYAYKPQNEDEVELSEGDIVYVMEKCDDGWFVGTSQSTGIFGTFPGNYVIKC